MKTTFPELQFLLGKTSHQTCSTSNKEPLPRRAQHLDPTRAPAAQPQAALHRGAHRCPPSARKQGASQLQCVPPEPGRPTVPRWWLSRVPCWLAPYIMARTTLPGTTDSPGPTSSLVATPAQGLLSDRDRARTPSQGVQLSQPPPAPHSVPPGHREGSGRGKL